MYIEPLKIELVFAETLRVIVVLKDGHFDDDLTEEVAQFLKEFERNRVMLSAEAAIQEAGEYLMKKYLKEG